MTKWGSYHWKVLTFGGIEVQLPIFGPAGADVNRFGSAVRGALAGRLLFRERH